MYLILPYKELKKLFPEQSYTPIQVFVTALAAGTMASLAIRYPSMKQ